MLSKLNMYMIYREQVQFTNTINIFNKTSVVVAVLKKRFNVLITGTFGCLVKVFLLPENIWP